MEVYLDTFHFRNGIPATGYNNSRIFRYCIISLLLQGNIADKTKYGNGALCIIFSLGDDLHRYLPA